MTADQGAEELRRQIEAIAAEVAKDTALAKQARPDIAVWWEDLPKDEFAELMLERMTLEQAETIKDWRRT